MDARSSPVHGAGRPASFRPAEESAAGPYSHTAGCLEAELDADREIVQVHTAIRKHLRRLRIEFPVDTDFLIGNPRNQAIRKRFKFRLAVSDLLLYVAILVLITDGTPEIEAGFRTGCNTEGSEADAGHQREIDGVEKE